MVAKAAAMTSVLVWALVGAVEARAQSFEGLDLTQEDPPATQEKRWVVVPVLSRGKLDRSLTLQLHRALSVHLGKTLTGFEKTWTTVRKSRLSASRLSTPQGVAALMNATGADQAISFFLEENQLQAAVYPSADAVPTNLLSFPYGAGITGRQADEVARALLEEPASEPIDVKETPYVPEVIAMGGEDYQDDDLSQDIAKQAAPRFRRVRPVGTFGVLSGVSMRDFRVSGPRTTVLAPFNQTVLASFGARLSVAPLQLIEGLADGRFTNVLVEAGYQRVLAKAQYAPAGQAPVGCRVNDDVVSVRGSWNYTFGTQGPLVGAGAGWSSERTTFNCDLPAVSTVYRGTSVFARARQSFWNERLSFELLGGPRFLRRGPAADDTPLSWEGEAWVASRVTPLFFARAGGRATLNRLAQGDALATRDVRTFLSVELGAVWQ